LQLSKTPGTNATEKAIKQITPLLSSPKETEAPIFVPVVIVLALFCLLVWSLLGGLASGIEVAVTVLIIANPRALDLAKSLGMQQALSVGALSGIILRKPELLQTLSLVKQKDVGTDIENGSHPVVVMGGD